MIWCVEDDASIRDIEVYALQSTGFEAKGFEDGDSFLSALKTELPELVILDVMLPGTDGIEVLKILKSTAEYVDIPVIMATAKGAEFDKVQGLDLGADDYLVKPFAFEELLARIRVMLRKQGEVRPQEEIFTVADLTVNCKNHEVSRAGNIVELSSKEFALLQYMVRNKGKVLSRDQIEQHIWDYDYMGSSNMVDVYIRYLRKKIDEPFEKKLIQTVRGAGYVLKE